jgi:cell division protein FtsW
VLLLFATLVFAGFRIAKRTKDPFARLAASAITVWIAAQALVNIGTVVGLVPVTGIPLPFISFGGSALVLNLVALGILLSFARSEPGAEAALKQHRGRVRALLRR